MSNSELTQKIKTKFGFKDNKWGDAIDLDNVRVYFDDNVLKVVTFNNPKSQLVTSESSLDTNMGEEKLLKILEAFIQCS